MKHVIFSVFIFQLGFIHNEIFSQGLTRNILWTTDWSTNGKYIAIGGNIDSLKIYSAQDLKLVKSYPIKNTITCVKWHPTKNMLAVGTQLPNNSIYIFDFDSNKTIQLEGTSPDGARGIDWNHTGEYLAVADNDGQISIFDITGKQIRKIKQENTKSITSIDWHPKKNILITVGDKIRMYDLDGTLIKAITHRQEDVLLLCVIWHNSGDFFVTGDYGDIQNNYTPLLQFWDKNGALIKSISESKGEYRNLSWNSKGDRLASASDVLRIWDKNGNLISVGHSHDYLWGVSWNKKADKIITTSTEQRVIIWDHKARKILTEE